MADQTFAQIQARHDRERAEDLHRQLIAHLSTEDQQAIKEGRATLLVAHDGHGRYAAHAVPVESSD